jgi:hypothetical protein
MTDLMVGSYAGFGLAILGLLLVLYSDAAPVRRRIALTLMVLGTLQSFGSFAYSERRICDALKDDLGATGPARIRAVTLGPAYPDDTSKIYPELFPAPRRIEDRQVIADLLQELKAPPDPSGSPAKPWTCRIDLDLGDHLLSFQVFTAPLDWRSPGVRIHRLNSEGRMVSGCHSWRRDALGPMLEWILRTGKAQ